MGSEAKRQRVMKPRHAIALALVGWYLMMPLVQNKKFVETVSPPMGAKTSESDCGQLHYLTGELRVDLKAPLSKWMIGHYSDSMQDCQAFLNKFKSKDKSEGNAKRGRDRKRIQAMEQALIANAKCVAGDDPRLKGNEEIREFQLMILNPKSAGAPVGCSERDRKD
ncbi:hypothetical protein [Candidatus Binatus soli]|jgi:hypothetical protein|uniref:hypothetical protein n=1 Tax=Candidatus Binatus soli TaxID=1953413 RepID=UPI003D0D2991